MFIDDPEVTAAEAVIDNGSFGKRVVRFETGRLAKQAAGSAMAYLDGETAVLSATTELRSRIWAGLAARGLASRVLATGGAALEHLVDAADRVRDLAPRVLLPPMAGAGTALGAVVAVMALCPSAVPTLLVAVLGGLLAAGFRTVSDAWQRTATRREALRDGAAALAEFRQMTGVAQQ